MRSQVPVCLLVAAAFAVGGCGGQEAFHVHALYHPRSNAYEDVRVYAEGEKAPGEASRRTNVTLVLRTLEGTRRVLRLKTEESEPYVAEDVPDTRIRRGLPLDSALVRQWLPVAQDDLSERHRSGEAQELLALVRAAGAGSRGGLPETRHLRAVEVR